MSALLEFRGAELGYKERSALIGINLSVESGSITALLGPNGSGKTTLLKTACGLIPPLSGEVEMSGIPVCGMKGADRASRAAMLFQAQPAAWSFTVSEVVGQGTFARRHETGLEADIKAAIAETGLSGFEERFVTELSGGELERVLIARAIAQNAPLLLLDEPLSGLDPKYRYDVMELLRALSRRGRGILLSMHDLNLASMYADSIALLSHPEGSPGTIAYRGVPACVLRPEILSEIYGLSLANAASLVSPEAIPR